jgi:acyl-CoA thioesterase
MNTASASVHTEPQALADASAEAMWSRDHATQGLGMSIVRMGPGQAVMSMPVRQDMLNGHDMCHGGFMFLLADSAFAFACNSYNQNTVASACHIDFLAPARLGDVLEAEAIERSRSGRTGVYDVTVRIRGGKTVALFRGKSYRIEGEVIAGLQAKA